jgi:hypothetical protein
MYSIIYIEKINKHEIKSVKFRLINVDYIIISIKFLYRCCLYNNYNYIIALFLRLIEIELLRNYNII